MPASLFSHSLPHKSKWESSVHPLIYVGKSKFSLRRIVHARMYIHARSSIYVYLLYIRIRTQEDRKVCDLAHFNPLAHLNPFPRKRPYKCNDRNDCSINKYLISYI